MANQVKPDVNTIWGSAGLATAISKAKQALGWVAEIPEYDQFNGMLQQISQFQQHVNQEGVALWDALTTYGVGSVVKSPVDRSLYRCLTADQLNVPPIVVAGGAVNANWVKLAHTDAEIQTLIGLYGVTAANLQQQTVTAFTSAGVAPTFTLTPTLPLAAYAANQRFRVKFNVAGLPGYNTLNISGRGAKNLTQYNSAGVKVAAVIAAGMLSDVEYDGADFVVLDPLAPATPQATEILLGLIKLATQAQVRAGADTENAVTSLRLKQELDFRLAAEYSTPYTISAGSLYGINHTKGIDASVEFVFVCLVAELGYSVNDEMEMKDWRYNSLNSEQNYGVFLTSRTATSFVMAMEANATWFLPHKTTTIRAQITLTRWAIKARIK